MKRSRSSSQKGDNGEAACGGEGTACTGRGQGLELLNNMALVGKGGRKLGNLKKRQVVPMSTIGRRRGIGFGKSMHLNLGTGEGSCRGMRRTVLAI